MTATASTRRPTAGAPRPYRFPDFERHTLSNGLTVWLVPLEERRMVHAHLLVDAGAASEPEEQGGIAALTAQMLVTGTRRLDAAAFAEATERLGIEISSESGWDSARAAFATLDRHLGPALHLLAEMVTQPRFDAGEFDRLRAERLNDILQGRADPGRLADELFLRNVYAASTPYHRPSAGVPETVGQLAIDDVRAFHARTWGPSAAHLVIAGGFATDEALRLAELDFGAWAGTAAGHQAVDARPAAGRRVVLVDRPGSVQSELRVGQIGIDRYHPRYFPAMVMGALLGGVFGSRLNLRLREELGYTYGARCGFDPRRAAGPFIANAAVHTEVTAPAIGELLGQLERIRATPPQAAELAEVRDFMVGVFPLRFETTAGVAAAIEPLAVYGLPDDWWQRYRGRIEAVAPEDVLAAGRELIDPDALLVLAVGDVSAVRDDVERAGFGPVEVQAAP